MNNTYYPNVNFPGTPLYPNTVPNQESLNNPNVPMTPPGELPMEQSYIENILRLNRGKMVRVHMTFTDSNEWRDRVFVGIVEQSGRDHIILSDPATGRWYLLLMIYLNFIEFDEKINYSPEFVPNQ